VLEAIRHHRATHAHMVPTMVQQLLESPALEAADTSSLRCIVYAAAPMPVPVLKRAIARFGKILVNGYGLTEGGHGSAFPSHLHRPEGDADDLKRLASVGQPTAGTQVIVADAEDRELARGQIGELLIRSPSNMLGYWNNHPATVEALRNGWVHTGDVGYMDEQGYIFLVDRKKDMIISGGENIYCREVEEALIEHPALADVAVIGVPDEKWGEAVLAVAVKREAAVLPAEELIAHCRSRIAGYKCPKRVEFVAELPRLPSGKVSKVKLRERFAR